MCSRFGWNLDERGPIRKNATEQATIARAGELARSGLSAAVIARTLNREGRRYLGGSEFDADSAQSVVGMAKARAKT